MPSTILMRVLDAGDRRIASGEHCRMTSRPLLLAAGAVFACPPESMESYVDRRWAEPVATEMQPALPAPQRSVPDAEVSVPGNDSHVFDADALARLMLRAVRDSKTGCLIWQGARNQVGYGQITYRRRNWTTHRLAWVAQRGALEQGLRVRHRCSNRACLALEHLYLGDGDWDADGPT